jgi:anti-anti-sigma factor
MTNVEQLERTGSVDIAVVVPYAAGHDLARAVGAADTCEARHVVVDLNGAAMLDAATLATLKRVAERLRSREGELTVVCAQPGLATLLRLTALDRAFRVVDSVDAALRS